MFCKNCGARIDDGSVFCGECGSKQPAEAPSAPQAPVQPYMAPYQQAAQPQQPTAPFQQPTQPQQPVAPYQQPIQQPVKPYEAPYQQPQPQYGAFQPPKKSKGPLVAILIIAAVVVLALVGVLIFVLTKNNSNANPSVTTNKPSVTESNNVGGTDAPAETQDPLSGDDTSGDDYDVSDEFMGIWKYGTDTYVQINYTYVIVMQPSANAYEKYDNDLTNEYLKSAAFGGKCSYTFSDDGYSVAIHPDEAGEDDVNLEWIGNLYDSTNPEIGVWENVDLAGEILFLCENGYSALMNTDSSIEGTYSTYGSTEIDFVDTTSTTYAFTNISFEDEDDTMYLTLNGTQYTFTRLY